MNHAPECAGKVYGCLKCGRKEMTINESFEHHKICKGNPDYNVETDSPFRMQHGLKVELPVVNRHGDLICPCCGNDDLSLWADDGEADLADWWECPTWDGRGCGASGALVKTKKIMETQNGLEVTYS